VEGDGAAPGRGARRDRPAPVRVVRIMIATETYTPVVNGPTVFTERLATGLTHRGHDVAVAAPSPNGHRFVEKPSRGLTIYRVRSIPTPYPRQRCALLTQRNADGLLTAFHPDLVHIQNHFVLGRALARAARRRQIPAVGTNHFMPANMLPHAPGVLLRLAPFRRGLSAVLWRQFVSVYRALDAVTAPSQAAAALAQPSPSALSRGLRGKDRHLGRDFSAAARRTLNIRRGAFRGG